MKSGAAIYAARESIVEPVFGQIKQGRGFRRFLLRGLEKVKAEWAFVCLTHNILKMCRICYGQKTPGKGQSIHSSHHKPDLVCFNGIPYH